IKADTDAESGVILTERSGKKYVKFDIDAGEITDVRFRWQASEEVWSGFIAEVNPVCDDYDIQSFDCELEGDGFASETDRMFDELNRYTNNEYPTTGVFEQSNSEVLFEILPDFKIKKVVMDPRDPEVAENVEITVTLENIGNADWDVMSGSLLIVFEDGVGPEITTSVGESINKEDSIEVKFSWTVPDEDKDTLFLTFTIDAGSGQFEIEQCDTCDDTNSGDGKDNDEYTQELPVVLSAVLGEIEFITTLTERDLVRGVPLIVPVLGLIGLVALAIPLLIYRRRSGKKRSRRDDDEESEEEDEDQAPAPPAKIAVAIVSTLDGKTANVKVPSNMPVNKLLQNCVGKFPLPHANFAVMLNGVAVDINLSLEDAGLTDGCQVDLVPLE
ncbi:MAG: CARDB domain-containing protein, partial [Candidatus Thermoplasmatota archaeon]|nr:CARDB domain-containing protein [Candidatus Thermoplasmatota archaeon]